MSGKAIDPQQTVREVVFGQIEELTMKECAGIVVDTYSYDILKKEADKTSDNMGASIKTDDMLTFRGVNVYSSRDFPAYTATLIYHKPSCLFCHKA